MATRLDRLFVLLDTGSTPLIRKSAAEQLGQVQKLHPHELNNLLTKVHQYLCSSAWETRIAAGQAVHAICSNVAQWQPKGALRTEDGDSPHNVYEGRLTLAQFDVSRVLRHGASLMASEGKEYDTHDSTIGGDSKESLARQKQLLNKRLGLDVAGGLGVQGPELFAEEDLIVKAQPMSAAPQTTSVHNFLSKQLQSDMSARERNRAKRKARALARQGSRDGRSESDARQGSKDSRCDIDAKSSDSQTCVGEPRSKSRRTSVVEQTDDKLVMENSQDNGTTDDEDWPFECFCDQLLNDLFNPSWEIRHGAATGLREVINGHGNGAGRSVDTPSHMMESANQLWLEDTALRLICVLALDRFGDFVSDEVVAPVRETCAQTLGTVLRLMDTAAVLNVMKVLVQLLAQCQWEVRHGGYLGLKYLLAVKQNMSTELLPEVIPYILKGFQDGSDDVRAVAASALLPVTNDLVNTMPHVVESLLACLWGTLRDLDDLTSSTCSVMTLLATLVSNPAAIMDSVMSGEVILQQVPQLFPFLSHYIHAVRKAVLDTLAVLLTKYSYNVQHEQTVLLGVIQDTLRHVYQRSLLEERPDVLHSVLGAWSSAVKCVPALTLITVTSPYTSAWLCLMMHSSRTAFDSNLLIEAKQPHKDSSPSRARATSANLESRSEVRKCHVGGNVSLTESTIKRDVCVIRARLMAARLLGLLFSKVSSVQITHAPDGTQIIESPHESLCRLLLFHLITKSAIQRFCVAQVLLEWLKQCKAMGWPAWLLEQLHSCLVEAIYYDEMAVTFTRLQKECQDFIVSLRQQQLPIDQYLPQSVSVLTVEQAQSLATDIYGKVKDALQGRKLEDFESRRQALLATVELMAYEQHVLSNRVQSSIAGCLTVLGSLPAKMNPIVRPLMDAVKNEENSQLQTRVAESVSALVKLCVSRDPCPTPKIIKNLCTCLCSDALFTPVISPAPSGDKPRPHDARAGPVVNGQQEKYDGILTLNSQKQVSNATSKRGRPSSKKPETRSPKADGFPDVVIGDESAERKQILIQRRGATLTLSQIASDLDDLLIETVPQLWEAMTSSVDKTMQQGQNDLSGLENNDNAAQELVICLQMIEVLSPSLSKAPQLQLMAKLPSLKLCLCHPYCAVRHMTSRALGMLSKTHTTCALEFVLEQVLPMLGAESIVHRQGAIEAVTNVIDTLGLDVVPYIVLLIVPVLGQMSDQNNVVRLMATQCFATLIKLLPLEAGVPDPPSLKQGLVEMKGRERKFLEQLLDGSKIEAYIVPVPINATLRQYQQDGINWLAFLNKYKLHGILCDDMGLGKTLQSLCILAGDSYLRAKQHAETGSADSVALPSIVVCPPTVTGHWMCELQQFVGESHLNPLHYTGPPAERHRLQNLVHKHNLIIASYEVVRNDATFFSGIKWNYCILDEGHIIKNCKTKIAKAVKQLQSNHRLILSGTPIQNNVVELWSLFDFLMPGFLGTERQFQARYGKPILMSRDSKSSSREQEAGALAMEALHRQVLPFLLRRMKEDVLQDLPPKIIQDYYCDLSPLQVRLYEDFSKSRARKSVGDVMTDEPIKQRSPHVFQALQYLRKVCNHPALVLTPQHPEYDAVMTSLKASGSQLRDLSHSPKLIALKQLLHECGIGDAEATRTSVVNPHRVLIFCQLKSMLDIVEHDLLKKELPGATYMRLDGSVPAANRISIVNRFNNDPSIDILLLTTHVGGLGLNLTGADTVMFVEHDWNPMKDLQAMDRAHRIGQKRVVNVYRLITRGTLEEKIMGLQKFKLSVANTVISQENSSLASMATDQLLELFSLDEPTKAATNITDKDQSEGATQNGGAKQMLDNLEELWDNKQYESEYDLGNFMQTLAQ